jgi:hypothetical protein
VTFIQDVGTRDPFASWLEDPIRDPMQTSDPSMTIAEFASRKALATACYPSRRPSQQGTSASDLSASTKKATAVKSGR